MTEMALCVDDFGLKPEVNRAVIVLAQEGLITATSVLSTAPHWAAGAPALRAAVRGQLDVGLHLNFTEAFQSRFSNGLPNGSPKGLPNAFPKVGPTDFQHDLQKGDPSLQADCVHPLSRLILLSLMRRLDPPRLTAAIAHQLDAFERVWGEPPDYVDGHQHVHQLPQIREALIEELDCRYGSSGAPRPWLRSTRCPKGAARGSLKPWIIEALGGRAWVELARRHGYALSTGLSGVYGFEASAEGFAARLDGWLAQAREGEVLMMHPAVAADPEPAHRVPDPIARAREVEFEVLSRHGHELLRRHGIRPVRLSRACGILVR